MKPPPLEGSVKVYKSIRKNKIWRREPFTYGQAFLDLLLLAVDGSEGTQTLWVQGEAVRLEPGQVGWSVQKLSDEWKRTRPWVNRFLAWGVSEGMLTVDSNHRRTIITLLNYDAYQDTKREKRATDSTAGLTTEYTTDSTTEYTTDSTTEYTTDSTTAVTHKGKRVTGNGKKVIVKGEDPGVDRFACQPAVEVVMKCGANWPGDLSRMIQPVMPEAWVLGWYATRREWRADWPQKMAASFVSDWLARYPKTRHPAAAEKKPGNRPDGRTVAQARFEAARELEEIRERRGAAHELGMEPDAAERAREKELSRQLKEMT